MQLATYVVERDEDAIARLVEGANEVMAYITVDEWPPSVPKTTDVARHTTASSRLSPRIGRCSTTGWPRATTCTTPRNARPACKRRLTEVLGDAQAATIDGRQVLTYRAHTRSSIDLDRLRAEHHDLAAELTTQTLVRVLRPITGKGER